MGPTLLIAMRNVRYLLAKPEHGYRGTAASFWILVASVIGQFKPLIVDDPPPGEIATFIFVPILAVALWFSLPRTDPSLVQSDNDRGDGNRTF